MTKLVPALLSIGLVGCAQGVEIPDDGSPDLPELHVHEILPVSGDAPVVPLVADMCDEPTFAGVTWLSTTTDHFTLRFLPGTAAERDQDAIGARLEAAYENIRSGLGITAEPQLLVNLSPSRNAAYQHNLGFGRTWPFAGRYDVIYTGAEDSYEIRRYGQLLTSMLDYDLDTTNRERIPLLATGIGEYFDQSGRDLHLAYARALAAGLESRVHIADFDDKDVIGSNPARAGSLVKFLVDRYGLDTFVTIYKATAIAWNSGFGCNWSASYGCVSTPAQLTALLDDVLAATVGESWSEIQPEWESTVQSAFDAMPAGMAASPTAEIENVLRVMDDAINTASPDKYRSTMEGFYCNGGGDSLRAQIAERAVTAYTNTHTQVLGLFDTGIKNFSSAQALVMRTDASAIPTFQTITFEHVEAGWRISYSPDWD